MPDNASHAFSITRGRPIPLGVTRTPEGINFALLCRHGTSVILEIYPDTDHTPPVGITLDPLRNRTGDHWHICVGQLPSTFRYGWRVDGPSGPKHHYDPSVLLLDPAATMIAGGETWGHETELDVIHTERRSLFHTSGRYNWGDDAPPRTPLEDSIVYELHVRGFTCDPSSGVAHPGTYRGLIEKIPYLQWLGVTAVELLPIHEFDETDCPFTNPLTGERLHNFWGYNSIAFAAAKTNYAASARELGMRDEFREMVKAFHAAGIEVILDVVFNHTAEGDHRGRTYSFRGLDNELYYLLSSKGEYLNYTGCGNTLNCNHPLVRELLVGCLRFWVSDMHIDGFRFDLASILGRDRNGHVMVEPPVIEMIAEDGVLADTKLIAEPWDAAGLYQVGNFPFGRRWSEWNGRYRDDVRRFWRGEPGLVGPLATRLCGSADLYEWSGRLPHHSVNFVTCHDGFTLSDLVSYDRKHNEANGEQNRDGGNDNHSWNCGAEGPTDDPGIMRLRHRQARNMMATLLLSQGVPMILAGDEMLRTQKGNNNAWCQDNDISWVNWKLAEENEGFLRFVRELIHLRRRHPVLRRRRFFHGPFVDRGQGRAVSSEMFPPTGPVRPSEAGVPNGNGAGKVFPRPTSEPISDIHWHGTQPKKPDFGHFSRTLAFALDGRLTGRESEFGGMPDCDFYIAMNSWRDPLTFRVPISPSRRKWHRVIDTGMESPEDFIPEGEGPEVAFGSRYRVEAHSLIVLISEA